MANRTVTLTGTTVGTSITTVDIYHTTVDAVNLVVSGVTREDLIAGYSFVDDDTHNIYIIVADSPCSTQDTVTFSVSPTPTATVIQTSTPPTTPTTTPTSTVTQTPGGSPTATPTNTPTITQTLTQTQTNTPTPTLPYQMIGTNFYSVKPTVDPVCNLYTGNTSGNTTYYALVSESTFFSCPTNYVVYEYVLGSFSPVVNGFIARDPFGSYGGCWLEIDNSGGTNGQVVGYGSCTGASCGSVGSGC